MRTKKVIKNEIVIQEAKDMNSDVCLQSFFLSFLSLDAVNIRSSYTINNCLFGFEASSKCSKISKCLKLLYWSCRFCVLLINSQINTITTRIWKIPTQRIIICTSNFAERSMRTLIYFVGMGTGCGLFTILQYYFWGTYGTLVGNLIYFICLKLIFICILNIN